MENRIYFDNNATTALDPFVFKAMLEDLKSEPHNPSSVHFFGQQARSLLIKSRKKVASCLNVQSDEIIFTSGGTEALNLTIRGIAKLHPKGHIITTDIDHSCVYNTIQSLEKSGFDVTYIKVGPYGAPTPAQIQTALQPNTKLIIISAVNGETGVKTDLDAIAQIAKQEKIFLIVDGVALMGKELFDIPDGISAICFSGHKFHGPKGIGFAYVSKTTKLEPLTTGGDQEFQRRPGTENLSGILGLAEAMQLLQKKLPEAAHFMEDLRDRLEIGLKKIFPDLIVNGIGPRICNTTNLAFPGISGESLLMHLDMNGIAASHGSACASGALEPSRVLRNMGIDRKTAASSLRFSLSRMNTKEEIDRCIEVIEVFLKKK